MQGSENPFWSFSLSVYNQPGVAAECLALQRALEADVNILLFCAWVGRCYGVLIGAEQVERLDAEVRAWRDEVIQPLRRARDAVKANSELFGAYALRREILQAELSAERTEQMLLFALTDELRKEALAGGAEEVMTANVRTYLRQIAGRTGAVSPADPVKLLAASLQVSAPLPETG